MAQRLDVRRAVPGDEAVVQGILEGAQQWLHARGIAQWRRPFDETWVAEKIAAGEVYVARLDDEPVGVVRVLWSDDLFWGERENGDAVYVHSLAVRRGRAGSGIGAALLRWVENRAHECGRRFARLDCTAENPALAAYYEGHGFAPVGTAGVGGEAMTLFEKALTEERA